MRERVRSVHAPSQKNGLTVRLHDKAARAEVRSEEQKWYEVPMPLPVTRTMGQPQPARARWKRARSQPSEGPPEASEREYGARRGTQCGGEEERGARSTDLEST